MFDYEIIACFDPGSNGGCAVYKDGKIMHTFKMTKGNKIDYKGIKQYMSYLKGLSDKVLVGIEKVQPRPQDGAGMKFMRMDKLFENRARLQQIILDLEIDYIGIPVVSWVNQLGLKKPYKDEPQTDRKNRYKAKAAELFPYIKCVGWNSDALLMVRFLQIKLDQDRNWFQKFPIERHLKTIL